MNMFANLTNEGLEKEVDRLGGGNAPLTTDIYKGIIKLAYAGTSTGGSKFVALLVDVDGRDYRETIYVTNRQGQNFYMSKDNKKVPLPGFSMIDNICLLTTEQPLAAQNVENKVVKLWSYEENKEIPQEVPVLTDLLGKQVALAIEHVLENKTQKNHDGVYVPIPEERNYNTITKAFHHETMVTVTEALNGLDEGEFHAKWLDQNQGKVRDKRTIKDEDSADKSAPPSPNSSNQAAAPKRSLFGKK